MPIKFGIKSRIFSRSCIDLSSTRGRDGDSEIIVAMGLGFRGSQVALGQVTNGSVRRQRSRRHSHSSRTANGVSSNGLQVPTSGGRLSRNNSRGKSEGRLSRNNSRGKSDGRLSRNNSRGKGDGKLSRSNSRSKADGRVSRNNSRGKSDGRVSRNNSRGKADGRVSRSNSRVKPDSQVSQSNSLQGNGKLRLTRSNSQDNVNAVRLSRSHSHGRADARICSQNGAGSTAESSAVNGLSRSFSHGHSEALSVLARHHSSFRAKSDEVHWKTKVCVCVWRNLVKDVLSQ